MVEVSCDNCKQIIRADDRFFGKTVKCPKCQAHLKIPDPRAEADQPADPLVGTQIAHYRIEALLGKGAMGTVYRAKNVRLNRTCALKILPEHFATQDKSRIERFIREAQSAANVEHSNVLPVYSIDNVGDTYFIEMQFVDGGSLDGVVEARGRLEPGEAARIVREVAAGLGAAHAKGIIHRDVKPSNVMLTKEGQAKVADFGLARMGEMTTKLTASGMILGTPLYMSPEQCEGKPLDHRSDIYSLGVMFYQLLAGAPPYTADTPIALVYQHINNPVPDLRQAVPDAPPVLAAVVARMMAKKPEERYQSCAEIINDLNGYLGWRAQTLSGRGTPAGISESTMPKAAELSGVGHGSRRRRRVVCATAGGMALLIAAIFAVVLMESGRDPARQAVAAIFSGPLNAALTDKASAVLIVPTHENDGAVQERIRAFATGFRDNFFKGSPILTDAEALGQDLSSRTVVVFGTPKGNRWLEQLMGTLPVRIEANQIAADTVYPGDHMRCITVWPNPQDPSKGVVIYTAQQAEDVIGINSVVHGGTDYVIARDTAIVKAGNYRKQNGKWSF